MFVFLSVQSEYDEFISSGLYLVVLLHFCEQRFSDVLGAVDAAGVGKHTHALSLSLVLDIHVCKTTGGKFGHTELWMRTDQITAVENQFVSWYHVTLQ